MLPAPSCYEKQAIAQRKPPMCSSQMGPFSVLPLAPRPGFEVTVIQTQYKGPCNTIFCRLLVVVALNACTRCGLLPGSLASIGVCNGYACDPQLAVVGDFFFFKYVMPFLYLMEPFLSGILHFQINKRTTFIKL